MIDENLAKEYPLHLEMKTNPLLENIELTQIPEKKNRRSRTPPDDRSIISDGKSRSSSDKDKQSKKYRSIRDKHDNTKIEHIDPSRDTSYEKNPGPGPNVIFNKSNEKINKLFTLMDENKELKITEKSLGINIEYFTNQNLIFKKNQELYDIFKKV